MPIQPVIYFRENHEITHAVLLYSNKQNVILDVGMCKFDKEHFSEDAAQQFIFDINKCKSNDDVKLKETLSKYKKYCQKYEVRIILHILDKILVNPVTDASILKRNFKDYKPYCSICMLSLSDEAPYSTCSSCKLSWHHECGKKYGLDNLSECLSCKIGIELKCSQCKSNGGLFCIYESDKFAHPQCIDDQCIHSGECSFCHANSKSLIECYECGFPAHLKCVQKEEQYQMVKIPLQNGNFHKRFYCCKHIPEVLNFKLCN